MITDQVRTISAPRKLVEFDLQFHRKGL